MNITFFLQKAKRNGEVFRNTRRKKSKKTCKKSKTYKLLHVCANKQATYLILKQRFYVVLSKSQTMLKFGHLDLDLQGQIDIQTSKMFVLTFKKMN